MSDIDDGHGVIGSEEVMVFDIAGHIGVGTCRHGCLYKGRAATAANRHLVNLTVRVSSISKMLDIHLFLHIGDELGQTHRLRQESQSAEALCAGSIFQPQDVKSRLLIRMNLVDRRDHLA